MLPMYSRRDCLDKLGLTPVPMPNVDTGMGGGSPGIARIGGIWVRFAPGRLNNPENGGVRYQYVLTHSTVPPNVSAVRVDGREDGWNTVGREHAGKTDAKAVCRHGS